MFFSVIVPLFNKEKFIKKTLDSLFMQSFKNFEIIVVDDCSTDKSLQFVQEYKNLESEIRIVILNNDNNSGVGFTRNKGAKISKGKYLIFLDADDELESIDILAEIQLILIKHSIHLLLLSRNYHDNYSIPSYHRTKNYLKRVDHNIYKILKKDHFAIQGDMPFGGSASAVIHNDITKKISFNESEKYFEDWDYFIKIYNCYEPFFLNKLAIKVNLDKNSKRPFQDEYPIIYKYLINERKLKLTRKKIFWIWYNMRFNENKKFTSVPIREILINFSIHPLIIKLQIKALLNSSKIYILH